MAVCEIWDVQGRLDHPLDYAENPEKTANPKYTEADLQALGDVMKYATNGEKTERQFFVSGVNCDVATARQEMMIAKEQFHDQSKIVCYHGYQSFKEGEVTPEQAHEVGVKLAEKMWGDRFQVIVADTVKLTVTLMLPFAGEVENKYRTFPNRLTDWRT
ncbi:MAG: relaxase/mobilization nuclease domain-containing protein [Lachnospiraceae bacterium]|nr:relaxase/mobilization nuclease domain-containing protein [Lachnospiraceae bacterium]